MADTLCPSPNTSHGVIFTTMPPCTKTTHASKPASDRLRTWSKNADVHPGTAAQDALRVNTPHCDPAIIQSEKDAVKERKALKAKDKEANQTWNDATRSIADEFRAQQASKQAIEDAEMPHKASKGRVSVTDIC